MRWLIYGATGYTGQLIAHAAIARGHRPILAGRSQAVAGLAERLGCEHRVFTLDAPDLRDVAGVCHVAGPFTATCRPMLAACLSAGVHYLDLATEPEVFEHAASQHGEAVRRGIVLLPGAGFNVAVTDCLAVALRAVLPDADRLTLAVDFGEARHSYGGAVMGVEALAAGAVVREHDRVRRIPYASRRRTIPFRAGPRHAATVPFPFGDVVTARHSTGIRNIEIYLPIGRSAATAYRAAAILRGPISTRLGQRVLKRAAKAIYASADDREARARVRTVVWGEVADPAGGTAQLELTTPHAYAVTGEVAIRAMEVVGRGPAEAGFRTPGRLLGGMRFIESLSGVAIGPIVRCEPAIHSSRARLEA